jgi:hypothetical protein
MDTAYCEEGACPPGQTCEYTSGECSCVNDTTYCENAEVPACDGICQTNMHCENVAGGCECVYDDCEDISSQNACSLGQCPPGERCVMEYGGVCTCVETDCEDADVPACDGDCPRGQYCDVGPTGGVCMCYDEEVDCEDSDDWPTCGGDCPPGETCTAWQTDECRCVEDQDETPCEGIDSPNMCDQGYCPPGQTCLQRGNGCACGNPVYECSNNAIAACVDQACPSGQKCVAIDSYNCECIPDDEYSCGYMDTAYCSDGTCPPGTMCSYDGKSMTCICMGPI